MRKQIFTSFIKIIVILSSYIHKLKIFRYINYVKNLYSAYEFSYRTGCAEYVDIPRPHFIIGHKYIQHKFFSSGPGLRIECIDSYHTYQYTPKLIIGNNVSFNFRCHIGCINKIVIGDNVLIGSNVLITDHAHGYNDGSDNDIIPKERFLYSKGPVMIEDNVWIGENVSILPNVTIGRNSIIGANSVITKSIPSYSIVVGSSAKVLKYI